MFVQFILVVLFYINQESYGQDIPKVNPFVAAIKPVIGGKTSFTCQSLYGSPPLQVNWFKDGKEIGDSSFVRIKSHEDPSILIIESIQSTHSGNYSCKMFNRFGHDSYTAELFVEGAPNWVEKPKSVKSNVNQTVTISCSASGYPKAKVYWKIYKNSIWANLEDNLKPSIKINNSHGKLTIHNINRNLVGKYACFVSNGIKPDLWSEFDLEVQDRGQAYVI